MEWMILPLKRYAQFSGRSRRKEIWLFVLFVFLVGIVAGLLDTALGFGHAESHVSATGASYSWFVNGPVSVIWILGTLIPGISVGVRRLHDIDKSGWWLLISLVPFVGGIILIVFYCLEGTRGPNRFGPDPIAPMGDLHETFR
jgi:uncharacterized membrane protein YhaH (DUF805 family)